jgi:hypothetical protein
MNDNLVFTGEQGKFPEQDSIEFLVLAACTSEMVWPDLVLEEGDFERAIDKLKALGWGFEWVEIH